MNERINVAINGFGRIGTVASRIGIDDPEVILRAINAGGKASPYNVAAQIDFDSTYGRFGDHTVDYDDDNIIIDDETRIALFGFRALSDARWRDIGTENLTVIESTGHFLSREAVQGHLDTGGVRRVIITAPAQEGVPTIVRGVNDTPEYLERIKDDTVFAASSCSTNAIASTLSALESEFTLKWGIAKIPHAITNSQTALDSNGKDTASRRGLDAAIPAKTGSAKEVIRLFPNLDFFDAESIRIHLIGSVAMLAVAVEGRINAEDVRETIKQASATTHTGIVGIIEGLGEDDMFSRRIIGRPESSVINPKQISVNHSGNTSIINLQAWFDNEWGYANRVMEIAKMIERAA